MKIYLKLEGRQNEPNHTAEIMFYTGSLMPMSKKRKGLQGRMHPRVLTLAVQSDVLPGEINKPML